MSDLGTIGTAYVQIEPSFDGVVPKIDKEFGGSGKEAGNSFASGFASVVGGAGKVIAGMAAVGTAAVAAGSAAVTKLAGEATSNFGEFEQLVGGVETLFGNGGVALGDYMSKAKEQGLDAADALDTFNHNVEAQEKVLNNASNAYKTVGLDANSYMETVTSFSASLLQSVGGDTMKAAKAADLAITDMADNANKMGSSMESIQTAYQGFAKQNYTMLDNLKLGYGGTKSEMERLLADAGKISGVKYDLSNLDDVYSAIHVIQTEMGITGTTAKEASSTLQGSFATMGAAWQNVLTSIGSGEDLGKNIKAFAESAETYIGNLLPVIETSLGGVGQLFEGLAPVIAEKLPALLTIGGEIVNQLISGFLTGLPQMLPMIILLVSEIGNMIIENLPILIEAAAQIILGLATGLAQALPELIPTIVEVVLNIALYLIENVDLLIDAAVQLMVGLATGLVKAIPILIEKIPEIIVKLHAALLSAIPKLMEAGVQIIMMLRQGLVQNIPLLLHSMLELVANMRKNIIDAVPKFLDAGIRIVEGIKQGILNAWDGLKDWFNSLVGGLVDGVKDILGIHSPSRVFANEVGKFIPAGIAEGIDKGMGVLDDMISDMTSDMVIGARLTANDLTSAGTSFSFDKNDNSVYNLLAKYLPIIATGGKVEIILDGDLGRLFRAIQREARKEHQLTGNMPAFSGI